MERTGDALNSTKIQQHIILSKFCGSPWLELDTVREADLKVVIDAGNGAGSGISPSLLRNSDVGLLNLIASRTGISAVLLNLHLTRWVSCVRPSVRLEQISCFAHDGDADRPCRCHRARCPVKR